jgi:hypothetical protein
MKSHLIVVVLLVLVVFGAHAPAFAGPGDPRLVNGMLEWPRTLTSEPFVVVRGDDGVLYYITIAAARRDSALTAGTRVVVLGLEGRTSHEITALGIGTGDSTEAALASLQGSRPAAPTAAAVVAPTAPSAAAPAAPTAPKPAAPAAVATPTPPAAAVNTVTTAPVISAPATPANGGAAAIAAPGPRAVPPTSSAPMAAPPTSNGSTAPFATPPASSVTPSAPGVTPPTNGGGPNIISAPTASPVRSAAVAPTPSRRAETIVAPGPVAMPTSATDDRRWMEISGVVESLIGRTLVIRSEEGRVAVDVSSLSVNLDRVVAPGSMVRVYGLPVELRFKAMGFVDPGPRP